MDKKTIQVKCFAGLRKYFGNEVTVLVESGATYKSVIDALTDLKPEAKEVLEACRIAVNEAFVPLDRELNSVNMVFLIPPSSGG